MLGDRAGELTELGDRELALLFCLDHKQLLLSRVGATGRATVAKEMKVKPPREAGAGQSHFSELMNFNL